MRNAVLVSSALAPVALVGGWTVAAARQPRSFDSLRDTISSLAAHGAVDPWVMTAALAALGVCHLTTAVLLDEVGAPSRVLLAVGGLATVLVALFAQPNAGHVPAATVGFVALTLWPAFWPPPRRSVGIAIAAVLAALLIWLGLELGGGSLLGLSERMLAGAQALCPLGLVVASRHRRT